MLPDGAEAALFVDVLDLLHVVLRNVHGLLGLCARQAKSDEANRLVAAKICLLTYQEEGVV
jgi:hypothetical protein